MSKQVAFIVVPRRWTRPLVLGLVAAMLSAGCGGADDSPTAEARPEPVTDTGSQLIQILYVGKPPGAPTGGDERVEVEVIADGAERSRTTLALYFDAGEADETFLVVRDGNRALLHNADADPPYTVLEAADEHPDALALESSPWRPDTEQFQQVCPDASPAGTRTIAGRDAVGYSCTWNDPNENFREADEMWLDEGTAMILEYGDMKAQEVIVDPHVDETTFSTTPPDDADAEVVKATGEGPVSSDDIDEPELDEEARLDEIAAGSAMPLYYLGAEFAGTPVTDVIVFEGSTGEPAEEEDLSVDVGQTLSVMYGDVVEVTTSLFRPTHYRNAVECYRLADLRGVPTVEQADAVWLFTADLVIRLGSMAGNPQQAAAAAEALRDAGQDPPTGTDLPAPPARNLNLVDAACGANPGEHGELLEE